MLKSPSAIRFWLKSEGLGWSRGHAMQLALAAPSLRVLAVPLFRLAGRHSSSRSLAYAT
jgi:hypothetical protein